MRKLILILLLSVLLAPSGKSQTITVSPQDDSMLLAEKGMLLSDLQSLNASCVKLDGVLARFG